MHRHVLLARQLSGVVILCFVVMHLTNHALLISSIDLADNARAWLAKPWRSLPGTVLLYGAALVHALLALWTLYSRRTLQMPLIEMVLLIMGLLIPYLLIEHAVAMRLQLPMRGIEPSYLQVLTLQWFDNPVLAIQQSVALIIVWVHGCLGLGRALSANPRFRQIRTVLIAAAVLLPVLALIGYGVAGTETVERIRQADMSPHPPMRPMPESYGGGNMIAMVATAMRSGWVMLIAVVLILRQIRALLARAGSVEISYLGGALVRVAPGTSVLEASRINGIAHYSVCGGNGRCSTCRVRIMASDMPLPDADAAERATLSRINAGPDVRLACQLRPTAALTVARLIEPPQTHLTTAPEMPPEEREIAVMFCDLRNFTSLSERQLPYDVVFLLNRYFELVGNAVSASGGKVDKFIGDGVMAVFGLEGDLPHACRAALRAAALIRQEIAVMNRELHRDIALTIDVGIGIHAGPAIIGQMGFSGNMSQTAIGDTVNVASRLEGVSKDLRAPIVISDEVMAAQDRDRAGLESQRVPIRGREFGLVVWPLRDADSVRFL
ncbi:adenylate cyclase [Paracoccus laeviglucosivorans]|uniref:Adenylate cyclase n=2 Tax=Paracoccus laeviglucosivorans TaxID=1197861 RepID=A0A521D2N6_9RHOB|nr:adenylate cyclase [Paracoccus laeviglucosivorans]